MHTHHTPWTRWAGWCCCWLIGSSLTPCGPVTVAAAEPELTRFEFVQIRMGTPVEITVYASTEDEANTAAHAAYARIKTLQDLLSDYDPESELSRLGRESRPGTAVAVSPELAFVLSRSLDLSRRTAGAFDVSTGPVVNLWRIARRKGRLPDPAAIEQARQRVDYRNIRLDDERRTVELGRDDMLLDLGGIAKGYAADEALRVLKEHGLDRALVAVSGDIAAGSPPPGRDAWRIRIEALNFGTGPDKFLALANAAVSTSGDATKFVEIDGVRYSHIVNPRTGIGLTQRSSVTVVAPDAMTTDSLATAVSVLGPSAGLALIAETPETAAFIVIAADEGYEEIASPAFAEYLDPGVPAD